MQLPWPEFPSAHRPDETIRRMLDYIRWIAETISEDGFHAGAEQGHWRGRVQLAYRALFLPPVEGHGDPYPADVPPPVNPGLWPDIPAAAIPGMTVRHQLKVIGLKAAELRDAVWAHARPQLLADWDRRLATARAALDHGDALPLPEEGRTEPSAEILAEAQAQEEAFREHARKRAERLERLRREAARRSLAKKKKGRKKVSPTAEPGVKATAGRPKVAKKAARETGKRPKASPAAAGKRKAASRKSKVPASPTARTRKTAGRGSKEKAAPAKAASKAKTKGSRAKTGGRRAEARRTGRKSPGAGAKK